MSFLVGRTLVAKVLKIEAHVTPGILSLSKLLKPGFTISLREIPGPPQALLLFYPRAFTSPGNVGAAKVELPWAIMRRRVHVVLIQKINFDLWLEVLSWDTENDVHVALLPESTGEASAP